MVKFRRKPRLAPKTAIMIRKILEWIHTRACRHEDFAILGWEPLVPVAQITDALLYPRCYDFSKPLKEDERGAV